MNMMGVSRNIFNVSNRNLILGVTIIIHMVHDI